MGPLQLFGEKWLATCMNSIYVRGSQCIYLPESVSVGKYVTELGLDFGMSKSSSGSPTPLFLFKILPVYCDQIVSLHTCWM